MNEQIQEQMDELKTLRDEIRVKMHLAKADARDAFAEVERKFEQVQAEAKRFEADTRGARVELKVGFQDLMREVREAYTRLGRTLSA
jgi:uncharacterized protein YPO0396